MQLNNHTYTTTKMPIAWASRDRRVPVIDVRTAGFAVVSDIGGSFT